MKYTYQGYPIISEQISVKELKVLLRELSKVLANGIVGDVVELGCYTGTSALFEARALQEHAPHKKLWLYDSFAGLPAKTALDQSPAGEQFVTGGLRASRRELERNFKQAGLAMPHIKKAWFADLSAVDMPDKISFAFLDGDYYESVIQSLRLVWPQLSPGATVVVDDYQNEALPGAARAVNTWLANHPAPMSVEASLAIIRVS